MLAEIINYCKNNQISVFIDPVSSIKASKLATTLNKIDYIFPDRLEAEALLNEPNSIQLSDIDIYLKLIEKGIKNVVLTLGYKGSIYANQYKYTLIPAIKTDVNDVSGAGDALIASVIYGLINHQSTELSCQLGINAATITIKSQQTFCENLTVDKLYHISNKHSHALA